MIYLDHHSTTPVDERVLAAMLPYFRERFGNASSRQHAFGWRAELAVETAREHVAALLGAKDPKEIVFTSGATEANNLALFGAIDGERDHVVSVVTEHASITEPLSHIASTLVGVDGEGFVSPQALEAAITKRTALVSVMWANNEIGVIQPLHEIARMCREKDVWVMSDVAQAAGKIPLDVNGLDIVTLSAHKIYGPQGVGAMWVRRSKPRVLLEARLFGGGQERRLRPGTLNVAGIVGFGEAARIAKLELREEGARLLRLRERLRNTLFERLTGVVLNGPLRDRLPGNLNVSFSGLNGEMLVSEVSKEVAVSSGSACTSASLEPSHVLRAIQRSEELAHASLRLGLGRDTTEAEIDRAAEAIVSAVTKLRDNRDPS
jgi:cysteine desulfurase